MIIEIHADDCISMSVLSYSSSTFSFRYLKTNKRTNRIPYILKRKSPGESETVMWKNLKK
ncbi:unnamed protein product, partial [Brassica rapa subsp. trilocularis]